MSGRELYAQIRGELPGLKVLFTSGYPDHGEDIIATLDPGDLAGEATCHRGRGWRGGERYVDAEGVHL
jgi:hypothetical protein